LSEVPYLQDVESG